MQRFDPLLKLTFRGKRFDGPGLQLSVLPTLLALNDVLRELAHHLWREKGGGKSKPEDLDIRLHRLVEGNSITAEIIADVPLQLDLFSKLDSQDLRAKLVEASVALGDACASYQRDRAAIPLPRAIWPSFLRIFDQLEDDDNLALDVASARILLSNVRPTKPIRSVVAAPMSEAARTSSTTKWAAAAEVSFFRFLDAPSTRHKTQEFGYVASPISLPVLNSMPIDLGNEGTTRDDNERPTVPAEPPAEPVVLDAAMKSALTAAAAHASTTQETVTGEVSMASVKGYASVRIDNREVRVTFRPEDEKTVTRALHEHDKVRVRIRGPGEIDLKSGRLTKIAAEKVRIIEPVSPQTITEARLEAMASGQPDELLRMIAEGAVPLHLLSFAAEYAGDAIATEKVVPVLLPLLKHGRPTVREGALCGLRKHNTPDVVAAIRDVAATDHPILREIAEDVLRSFEEEE